MVVPSVAVMTAMRVFGGMIARRVIMMLVSACRRRCARAVFTFMTLVVRVAQVASSCLVAAPPGRCFLCRVAPGGRPVHGRNA